MSLILKTFNETVATTPDKIFLASHSGDELFLRIIFLTYTCKNEKLYIFQIDKLKNKSPEKLNLKQEQSVQTKQ